MASAEVGFWAAALGAQFINYRQVCTAPFSGQWPFQRLLRPPKENILLPFRWCLETTNVTSLPPRPARETGTQGRRGHTGRALAQKSVRTWRGATDCSSWHFLVDIHSSSTQSNEPSQSFWTLPPACLRGSGTK